MGLINYSQCWEDPDIVLRALSVQGDDIVLSVTSGGDNTLAILAAAPHKVISVDLNFAQNDLLALKLAAIQSLQYEELLEFLGVMQSSRRIPLFKKVQPLLTSEVGSWWLTHQSLISKGVLDCGRFERFLVFFRRYVLPLVHSRRTIDSFFSIKSLEEQRIFYRNKWNSKRWRFFFSIISSRFVLKYFARQRGMFAYAERKAVADSYLKRIEYNFTNISIADNYFMRYCLMGSYGQSLPPYLEKKNYTYLKDGMAPKLSIVTSGLLDYLRSMPADFFSKFNLSDIFEALSAAENDLLWGEILRTAKNGARIVYWNNLVPRSYPPRFLGNIRDEKQLSEKLYAKDRVFFYGGLRVHTIRK